MKTLYTVGISEFKKSFALYDNFQDKVIVADLTPNGKLENNGVDIRTISARLQALTFILVQKGTMKIYVDYYPYTLSANCILILMPTHILQVDTFSSDFQAKMLLLDMEFLQDNRPDNAHISITNFMEMRKKPVIELIREENNHLETYINNVKEKIRLRTHLLQTEVIKNTIASFALELANILLGKRENLHTPTLSRQEDIMNKFLTLLLEHCKEEHEVSFYAEKLFITPQYLSLVLKGLTGNTANTFIDKAIMSEAKILIRSNEYSIQQIADILHFADQSTFGKFFKKHTGVSPLEYKKRLAL